MFRITKAHGGLLRTTDDYGQAIFWARYYVTNCGIAGTNVWCGAEEIVYYTY